MTKKAFKPAFILSGLLLFFFSCSTTNTVAQTGSDEVVTYQTFYDDLSAYGTWIDYPEYGHVWNPRVEGDFRPYATNGHWVSSNEGWAWASDYDWGWGPFHYGRWLYDDMYGWLWIPGYDWSPAWVTWGTVDNYYCWAPLTPGINAGIQFDTWRPHSFYWNACSRDHIYDRNLTDVIERPERVSNFASRIAIVNNFNTTRRNNLYYSKGPEVAQVQKYVNRKIEQTSFREVNKTNLTTPVQNSMNVYRPNIQAPEETKRLQPEQVMQPQEFRRIDNTQMRPINTESQQFPAMQRNEQRANIERLPVFRAEAGSFRNTGGEQRQRRN